MPVPAISWADTLVLGAKVAAERSWFVAKKTRLGAGADVDTISSAFGADFPVFLGRKDADTPDPPAAIPVGGNPLQVRVCGFPLQRSLICTRGEGQPRPLFWGQRSTYNRLGCEDPLSNLQDFMKKLGTPSDAGTGPFAPKPLFWERPGYVIWTAAQPDPAAAEAAFAAADQQYAELKDKYDRSRRTVTRTGVRQSLHTCCSFRSVDGWAHVAFQTRHEVEAGAGRLKLT